MLRCKVLKTLLPEDQTIDIFVNKQLLLCSNIYSLHAYCFVKNVELRFWNLLKIFLL
jgi:hypothetical protein